MEHTTDSHRKVSLWDHLALIIRWKKLVIIFMLIMAVASVTFSLLMEKWYFSDARVLPPPAEAMGFAGMMPNLELGLLGDMTGLGTEAKLAVAILESRRMKDAVIDSFNWMEEFGYKYRMDGYIHYSENVVWEMTEEGVIYIRVNDTDPQRAANTVDFIVRMLADEYNAVTVAQARNQRRFIEKRLDKNRADLEAAEEAMQKFQGETGAISIEDQLHSTISAIAHLKTEQILAEVQYEVAEKTLPSSSSLVVQARERMNTLRQKVDQLMRRSDKEAPSVLVNLDLAPEIGIEYFRLYREIELQGKILEFLLPQYEQAKINESREGGNLYILDSGNVPEKKYKPKRAFVVIGWMFITFVLLYVYILSLEWLRRLREHDPERYSLVDGVIEGLKPKNFFSFRQSGREGP